MGKYLGVLLVLCMVLTATAAVHAENASSGYKNVVSKSILMPAMAMNGFDGWGQSAGWMPAINGSHPKPVNGSLQPKDIPDAARVPGVRHKFARDIVILSSKSRR